MHTDINIEITLSAASYHPLPPSVLLRPSMLSSLHALTLSASPNNSYLHYHIRVVKANDNIPNSMQMYTCLLLNEAIHQAVPLSRD